MPIVAFFILPPPEIDEELTKNVNEEAIERTVDEGETIIITNRAGKGVVKAFLQTIRRIASASPEDINHQLFGVILPIGVEATVPFPHVKERCVGADPDRPNCLIDQT